MKAIRIIVGLAFVGIATGLAFKNVAASGTFIVAVVLVAMSSRGADFVEFAIGPLKAKLREQVAEAGGLVETLKRLAILQAKTSIATSARMGRFLEDSWPYDSMAAFSAELSTLNLSEKDKAEVQSELVRFTKLDILYAVTGTYAPSFLGDGWQEWNHMREDPFNWDPDRVQAFLEKYNQLTPERAKLLDDYRWIDLNGRIESREQYLRTRVQHDLKAG